MSERMDTQAFMDRMRHFVADEPDSLSMEMVAMCATMIGWSGSTMTIVHDDFINWIVMLKDDAMFSQCGACEHLDELARRAIDVRKASGADNGSAQNDGR